MTEKTKENKMEKTKEKKSKLIVVVRISGMVKVKSEIENTLHRLRLRRKYSCIFLKDTKEMRGMLEKVKYYVAYGTINESTLTKLIKERAKIVGDKKPKEDEKEIAKQLQNGKSLSELKLKPFFRLHPPRKGIKSKLQYPKGVLGNNKEDINKLIEKML
jgi:large subunit ribosomal protein L30